MNRILFVDDEQRVLDGLRQALRGHRASWEMVFCSSGSTALAELERAAFDAVVSDMRMPGMDGAEFLARAGALQPDAVRIVLSGQTEAEHASRAAQVAHRLLAKPCDARTLATTISQALDIRGLLTSLGVRTCVSGLGTLPSPSRTCIELSRAIEQEASVNAIASILESDVAMITKVLQLANSSMFGLHRRVATIRQAVSFLGINTIRNVALLQSMSLALNVGARRALTESDQNRSLLASRIARALLPDKERGELAATVALLCDVGALAIRSRMPEAQLELETMAAAQQLAVHRCERAQWGASHAEIGAYLLGLWGLPFDVVQGVAAHHTDFAELHSLDVTAAVAIAASQADALLPSAHPLHADPVPLDVLQRLGVIPTLHAITRDVLSERDGRGGS